MSNLYEFWNPGVEPIRLVCRWKETEDTESFLFNVAGNAEKRFQFKPGQFVTLAINTGDNTYYRAYSISSVPGESHIQLTVKRVTDGKVSNWLIDHLAVDQELSTLGVAGEFNLEDCPPKDKVLLLGAGCGITPVMSMARSLMTKQHGDVCFIQCARDKNAELYREELSILANGYPDEFSSKLLLESSDNQDVLEGRVSKEYLDAMCPDWLERTVYLCGPNGFMKAVKSIALDAGFKMSEFHSESFTPEEAHNCTGESKLKVSVPGYGIEQDANSGTSLLEALESGGLPIIAACRSGVCGSCKCQVTQGSVTRTSEATLTEEEIANGYVLACSSQLETNVSVNLH
ncbi:hybrid-cluster NAD(P)-dependent oxidoreductase [Parasalinivibrio latis]|uniref:2Fe-2S iron-sulfur cluster-binding protein n=1 Tax=Parasalinivibrio latis TaxID=2952610 RepID=UPI0030DE71CB